MNILSEYYLKTSKIIEKVLHEEAEAINDTIELIQNAIENRTNIYVFGASHAGILTEELFYRAGGLAVINPIIEPSMQLNIRPITATSQMERLEGYGKIICDKYPIAENDIIICHSVSGRNSVMIDFVLAAKKKGAKIVAMTNISYSKQCNSRHSSGMCLYQLADIVIDNHGEIGDACITIEGNAQKVAPTSTVVSVTIFNGIIAQIAFNMNSNNKECPILNSANVDGGDKLNEEIFNKYSNNIKYL